MPHPTPTESPAAPQSPQTYRVGTLEYTTRGIIALFAWLLWGDFAAAFFGSIFGNAGGGQESGLRWVGEEGPELVASGPNAMRVYNMRQMAFAGGGPGGAKQTIHYHDNRNYSISGVETQQVFGYIEQTRREDQRGIVRMLERNGLGSMR